jgi:hypothetical protein
MKTCFKKSTRQCTAPSPWPPPRPGTVICFQSDPSRGFPPVDLFHLQGSSPVTYRFVWFVGLLTSGCFSQRVISTQLPEGCRAAATSFHSSSRDRLGAGTALGAGAAWGAALGSLAGAVLLLGPNGVGYFSSGHSLVASLFMFFLIFFPLLLFLPLFFSSSLRTSSFQRLFAADRSGSDFCTCAPGSCCKQL